MSFVKRLFPLCPHLRGTFIGGSPLLFLRYIDAVKPGKYGTPKPFYFLFLPSFWCGSIVHKKVNVSLIQELLLLHVTINTVEPLYCGHHWDRSKCPDYYRGVLISECLVKKSSTVILIILSITDSF